MGKLDQWSSLFWFLTALLICYHSYDLGLGTMSDPGSGFVFFCAGTVVACMALLIFIGSWVKKDTLVTHPFGNVNWFKIGLVLTFILSYGLLLEKLGFMLSTFLLVGGLLATIERKRWYIVFLVALGGALGTYGIFELWLHTRLPRGIFGI